ncbi:MAG: peptidoglycan DD-metalloendopeptidase family protein [Christensenellales bacterium]|jgi:murein DD-endopeptidase MepM/ murein hydrolase activator NlpD
MMEGSKEISRIQVGEMQPTRSHAVRAKTTEASAAIVAARSRRRRVVGSRGGDRDEEQRKTATLIIKACVCAALCLAAFLVHLSDTAAAQSISRGIRSVLTYNIDLDETLGKLKFVDNFIPGVQEVFTEKSSLIQPVLGSVSEGFSQNGRGILFVGTEQSKVVASADGYVSQMGEDERYGRFVAIKHGAGVETFYYGLETVEIKEGKIVSRGQTLGAGTAQVFFEVRQDHVAVDPVGYMDFAS